jgi:hypothetical protein
MPALASTPAISASVAGAIWFLGWGGAAAAARGF